MKSNTGRLNQTSTKTQAIIYENVREHSDQYLTSACGRLHIKHSSFMVGQEDQNARIYYFERMRTNPKST